MRTTKADLIAKNAMLETKAQGVQDGNLVLIEEIAKLKAEAAGWKRQSETLETMVTVYRTTIKDMSGVMIREKDDL